MLSLELAGEGAQSLPTDERNLAWRAAELMADHVGRAPDVAITIEKTIPVAGGMAGGGAGRAAGAGAGEPLLGSCGSRPDLVTHGPPPGCDRPLSPHRRAARRAA